MYLLPTKILAAAVLICVFQDMQVAAQEEKMWYRGTEIAPYRVIGTYYQVKNFNIPVVLFVMKQSYSVGGLP